MNHLETAVPCKCGHTLACHDIYEIPCRCIIANCQCSGFELICDSVEAEVNTILFHDKINRA